MSLNKRRISDLSPAQDTQPGATEESPFLWRPPADGGLPRGPEAVLLAKGHVTLSQLSEAAVRQQLEAPESSVPEVLVSTKAITEALAVQAVAAHFKLPSMQLDASEIDPDTYALLPEDYVTAKLVIPLRREGDDIVVGISYPADIFLIDDIKRRLGDRLRLVVVQRADILAAVDSLRGGISRGMEEIVRSVAQDDSGLFFFASSSSSSSFPPA